jgi:hypothetical protein
VSNLEVIAAGPTEVPVGEKAKLSFKYVLKSQGKTSVDERMAWRVGDGELEYGKVWTGEYEPGDITSEGWTFTAQSATAFKIYAVVKLGDKTYISKNPVTVTFTGASAQPAQPQLPAQPQPAQPQPAQPQPAQPQPAQPQPAQQPQPPAPPADPQGPGPRLPGAGAPPVQTTVDTQTYRDPGGRFSIDYPVGWRQQLMEAGFVAFFKDHPEEGTSFVLHPQAQLQGARNGREMIQLLSTEFRKRYPDLQILGQEVRRVNASQFYTVEAAILETAWTNLRGERMRARVAFVVYALHAQGMERQTLLAYWAYQAPEVAWDAMRPVFTTMYQSYTGFGAISGPP